MNGYQKFHNIIVNLPSLKQTGFFLTNSIVVTCAHGDGLHCLNKGAILEIISESGSKSVTVDYIDFNTDVILAHLDKPIKINEFETSNDVLPLDKLYSYGFTERFCEGGESCTIEVEGWSRNPFLLKLKAGAIVPGMSGAPLLNIKNNCIVGMIKSSRTLQNKSTPTGGRAIPVSTIIEIFNNCYEKNRFAPSTVCAKDLEIVYSFCEAAYATATPLAMSSDLIKHLKKQQKFSALINRQDLARRMAIKTWFSINPFCLQFIVTQDNEGKHRIGVTCVLPLTSLGYKAYKDGEIEEFKLDSNYLMGVNETDKGLCTHLCIQSFAFCEKFPKNGKQILKESFITQISKLANMQSELYIIAEIGTEAGRKMAEYFDMRMLDNLSYDKRPLYERVITPYSISQI